MAGKKQAKPILHIPEPDGTVEQKITIKKTALDEVKRYCDFIKRTTNYDPPISDVLSQGALFLIRRDTLYKQHREKQDDVIVKKVKNAPISSIEPALFADVNTGVNQGKQADS